MSRNIVKDQLAVINRASLHQRFGKDRAEAFLDLILGVADKEMFGLWGYNRLGQPQQFWANRKPDLNLIRTEAKNARKGGARFRFPTDEDGHPIFPEKLTRRRIVAHLLAVVKDEYVWYINKGYRGQDYKVLLCADIDWHQDLIDRYGEDSDAEAVAGFLREKVFPSCHWEPSTNRLGRHLYFLMLVPASVYHDELVRFLRALEGHISNLVTEAGFRAGCDEVKGQPPVFRNGLIASFGTLAKVPRPATAADMDALMALKPIPYAGLRDIVGPVEVEEVGIREEQEEEAEIVGDSPVGATPPKPRPTPSKIADLVTVADTFKRVKAAHKVWVRCNPTGSRAEFSRWYEDMGLKIGNSDDRLIAQAFEKYAKTRSGSIFSMELAAALYDELAPSDSDLHWRKGAKLSRDQVAQFWQLATTVLLKIHPEPRRQFSLSKEFVTRELRISGSQYGVLKRLSMKYGVLVVINDGYIVGGKSGISKKYGLGNAHPLHAQFEEMAATLRRRGVAQEQITDANESEAA